MTVPPEMVMSPLLSMPSPPVTEVFSPTPACTIKVPPLILMRVLSSGIPIPIPMPPPGCGGWACPSVCPVEFVVSLPDCPVESLVSLPVCSVESVVSLLVCPVLAAVCVGSAVSA